MKCPSLTQYDSGVVMSQQLILYNNNTTTNSMIVCLHVGATEPCNLLIENKVGAKQHIHAKLITLALVACGGVGA